jgi:predicted PurR-regulated permease PerM
LQNFRAFASFFVARLTTCTTSHGMIRLEPTPKGLLLTAVAVGLAWVAVKLAPVALVLVAALMLVGTLNPAVEWLEKRGWKRGLSIALVFTVTFVATLLLLVVTIPVLVDQLASLLKQEPSLRAKLADFLARSRVTASLAQSLREVRYDALAKASAGVAWDYSTRVVSTLAYFFSAIFLALYAMIDRDTLRGGLFSLVPRTRHIRLSRVLLNLETIVGGYIRGQLLTSLFMAVFTGTLLTACGVKNALALGVLAGAADVLPYIGVLISVVPAVVAALANGPATAMIVLVAMLVYEEFESRFLVPRIYGRALRLPSSVVLFALVVGSTLMGFVGALLALPAAAAVRMLVRELRVELPGEAKGDDVVLARDARAEAEYERRVEGIPAEQAAAVAVEISEDRLEEDRAIPARHAPGQPGS